MSFTIKLIFLLYAVVCCLFVVFIILKQMTQCQHPVLQLVVIIMTHNKRKEIVNNSPEIAKILV